MKNRIKNSYRNHHKTSRYFINDEECKVCGICFNVCSHGAITGKRKEFYKIVESRCQKCGVCKKACRHGAIGLSITAREILREEDMENYKKDFYQKLRNNISKWTKTEKGQKHKWTQYLLAAPDLFHVLCKSILDKHVPLYEKTKLALVVAYFVSPLDLIPEMIMGPAAYIDDVALVAYAINILVNNIDPQIITRHWAGDEDLLKTVSQISADTEMMIMSGMWKKIKKVFK
jgi:uncharacterized membrane protein YkvA (DUF1232 family)/Pyruvate/2-oxoacid:ferredoxin oxidoreductase delta subunit